jgi:hypothetical protein
MGLAPLDLVTAHPWDRVVFTTYALSLSFFEAVVLDGLMRGRSRSHPVILADPEGVRGSLSEQGAQRVGREYRVEPVSVRTGVFHPKISVFIAPGECHLLIGSGNLTFGGWGVNCEVIEHLHPRFAREAIEDAAEFFDAVASHPRLTHGASDLLSQLASELREASAAGKEPGSIRLIHNLKEPIRDQVVRVATALGGANRLVAIAPYWDDGAALDKLCHELGLDAVFVHSHQSVVPGRAGASWPRNCRSRVEPVRVAAFMEDPVRRLHAKAFEIHCRDGRVVVSGSANGTNAALGKPGNVEMCVVRVQHGRTVPWLVTPADPPPMLLPAEPEVTETKLGVLRAVLHGDELLGRVLTRVTAGPATFYRLTPAGKDCIAAGQLAAGGDFRVTVPSVEHQLWKGGRFVLRIEGDDGTRAEGFVWVAAVANVHKAAGPIARYLSAVLAGTETPADVAAIMGWFYENPERIGGAVRARVGAAKRLGGGGATYLVPVEQLERPELGGMWTDTTSRDTAESTPGWTRFIDHIVASFRESRGPFPTAVGRGSDDLEEGAQTTVAGHPADDRAIGRALTTFHELFELMTSDKENTRNILLAFDLTHYVCDRLNPDAITARKWLDRLTTWLATEKVPPARRREVAAGVLALVAGDPQIEVRREGRRRLLELQVDLDGEHPSQTSLPGFQSVIPQQMAFDELWGKLRGIRTYDEQRRAYVSAFEQGEATDDYSDLALAVPNEWPVLEGALTSHRLRSRLYIATEKAVTCPVCNIALPESERRKMGHVGVATAINCCRRVILASAPS